MQPKRVRTPQGDYYVQTPDREWSAAIERMRAAVHARDARMRAWETARRAMAPGGSPWLEPGYWEAYNREKFATPIEYPMPVGHVMFKGVA